MTDVVVVGAGPSGAVLTRTLARAGVSVVCLEQGDRHEPGSFPALGEDFEMLVRGPLSPDPNVRAAAADYPIGVEESDLDPLMFNAVGGSTILYAADWCRMRPSDFAVRSCDGVAEDWPITYADLEAHYDATDAEFAVSGLAGDPSAPAATPPPHGPLPVGAGGRIVAQAHDRLGWHWWPGTNAIDPAACTQWGTCLHGCPAGAKATPDITHWADAVAAGADLRTGARATRVVLDDRGRASGVEWLDRDGSAHLERGRVVVLAANGIGTPRLMLLSACAGHPDGLGNSSGLLGRRLMMHPFATVAGAFPEQLNSWLGHSGPKIVSYEFYETDASRGFVRGAKWSLGGLAGPVEVALDSSIWGEDHHRGVSDRLGRTMSWGIFCEDLPDPENRVTLDPALVDSDGLPGAGVRYSIDENTIAMLAFHTDRAAASLAEAGASEVWITSPVRESGWHLLGTTRMGEDPATSVVDPFGAVHDVPGLFIADGSIFVTSAGVNPTSTIAALSRRLAHELLRRRGSW